MSSGRFLLVGFGGSRAPKSGFLGLEQIDRKLNILLKRFLELLADVFCANRVSFSNFRLNEVE